MIPALKNAEFVRYGVMHRNTYIDAPRILNKYYQMKNYPKVFFAGQITGVEGYVESAASGLVAGLNIARKAQGKAEIKFTAETAIGALSSYVSNQAIENFQPMNVNFGIMADLGMRIKDKKEKAEKYAQRSMDFLKNT